MSSKKGDMFLGFEKQPTSKRLDAGKFRDMDESHIITRTSLEIASPRFSSLFLGFAGQPTTKQFGTGRIRDEAESYSALNIRREVLKPCSNNMFLGFADQPTTKPLDIGRFLYPGESYTVSCTRLDIVTPKYDSLFLGFAGQPTSKTFGAGRLRDEGESYSIHHARREILRPQLDNMFLGFFGQPTAKPFDVGRFRYPGESYIVSNAMLDLIAPKFASLFLGFAGQAAAKPFGVGRFRDTDESYAPSWARLDLVIPKYDSLFLGFFGQLTAKPFDVGRLRDIDESYHIKDTRREVAYEIDTDYGTRRIVLKPGPEPYPYIDHVERMRKHLISEFQWDIVDGEIWDDKPVLRAILTGIGRELDDLDKAIYDVNQKRTLRKSEGTQLDGLGEIVGLARKMQDGYIMADMEYRMAIAQKIRRNVTRGTVEDTIDSLKFVFDAPIIFLHESGNANIAVAVGRILKPYEIHVANAMDLVIRPGGVNLKYKSFFNYNHYFGFEGQLNSKGFSKGQFAEVF